MTPTRSVHRKWTGREVARLRRLYPIHTQKLCAALLSRSPKSVASKAKVLRLKSGGRWRPWSKTDDKKLRAIYSNLTTKKVAARLRR